MAVDERRYARRSFAKPSWAFSREVGSTDIILGSAGIGVERLPSGGGFLRRFTRALMVPGRTDARVQTFAPRREALVGLRQGSLPSPQCLQNSGGLARNGEDARETIDGDKRLGFKRLEP